MLQTLKSFNYFNQIINLITNQNFKGEIEIFLDGGRESGKTIATIIFYSILFITNENVGVWVFRHTPQGARESFKQFRQVALEFLNFPKQNFAYQDKTFSFKGHQIIFNGYLSNRKVKVGKLGIARDISATTKIIVFDEITEFTNADDIDYCEQAVGSAPVVVKIKICNPFSPYHWFVKQLTHLLPYKKNDLLEKGEQFHTFYKSENHLVILHHTNHRVNSLLEKRTHQTYANLSKTNPFLGLTADLGLPGLERGAVYLPLLTNIAPPPPPHTPIWAYRGGVDWGESSHQGASACAAIFGRIGKNYAWVSADNQYWHNNSKSIMRKDTQQLVNEVAEFFANQVDNRVRKMGGIEIFVDNAAPGIMRLLEAKSAEIPNGNFLFWHLCYKYPVFERIKVIKFLMAEKRIFINKTMCPTLWSEWHMATYDENKAGVEEVRKKENDDCLDAFEYLINAELTNFTTDFYQKIKKAL